MPTPVVSSPNTTSAVIARLRAWASAKGWTKSRFAAEARLRDTTLRGFHHPTWNPTREILERLESIVPPGWQAGDPLPNEAAGDETPAPNAVRSASAAGSGVPTGAAARPGEAA